MQGENYSISYSSVEREKPGSVVFWFLLLSFSFRPQNYEKSEH